MERYLIIDSLSGDLAGDLNSHTPGKAVQAVDTDAGKLPRFYVERARYEATGAPGYHVFRVLSRDFSYDYGELADLSYLLDRDCQYLTSFTYVEPG